MDLRQFLGTLRVRWKFSLITLVVGTVATILVVTAMAPQYGSTVKVFVSTPLGGQTDYGASYTIIQRVASYADLAVDQGVLQRVADRLDLDESADQLRGQVSADVVETTQTIEISVNAETPEKAQQIADAESKELVALVTKLEDPADPRGVAAVTARVASTPSVSDEPVSPNVRLYVAVGVLLSLFLAIAGALLRDLLDRTVKSREDVEETVGGAVMATLPYEPMVKKQPVISSGSGPLVEALRVLRTNLQFANVDASPQTILVSSALSSEGKTLVATNLALSMAQAGQLVLLVDADMRNPNVADLLGLENSVGLVSVLLGTASLQDATQAHVSGVSFLGTGPRPPNPAEVLNTQAMRDFLRLACKEYDVVVIDAPPMLPVADASILATEVDGTLLLARHGSTTRDQLRLAVERIETVGGRLFGTILNRTPRRGGNAYDYTYGYGYDYRQVRSEPASAGRNGVRGRRRAVRQRTSAE